MEKSTAFSIDNTPKSPKKNFKTFVALIDADRYKHVVTYRMSQKISAGGARSQGELDLIIEDYLHKDIFEQFTAKGYIFCFSAPSKDVFRNHIAQDKKYKGNRDKKTNPNYYEGMFEDMAYVFEYISKRYITIFDEDLEADDLLSFLQNENTFLFSHDKDLKQVIGYHYNMQFRSLTYTDEEKAIRMLIGQMYTGDSTDNIPGLAGYGPKKTENRLHNKTKMSMLFNCVSDYTEKHGYIKGIDTFVEMWGLLSMKMDRGEWFREKYFKFYHIRDSIINS